MLKRVPVEAMVWFTGLLLLSFMDTGNSHISLCPLRNAGFEFCPGCGLGRSVALFFHGEIIASLKTHPLGIFAVIVLSFRIINLTKRFVQNYGKSY